MLAASDAREVDEPCLATQRKQLVSTWNSAVQDIFLGNNNIMQDFNVQQFQESFFKSSQRNHPKSRSKRKIAWSSSIHVTKAVKNVYFWRPHEPRRSKNSWLTQQPNKWLCV